MGEYTPKGDDVPIQGARWTRQIAFTDDVTNDPLDLTGFSFRMQIRKTPQHEPPLVTFTIGNGLYWVDQANGVLLIDLSAAVTEGLPSSTPEGWYYDLAEIPDGNAGATTKPLHGRFPIIAGVTR